MNAPRAVSVAGCRQCPLRYYAPISRVDMCGHPDSPRATRVLAFTYPPPPECPLRVVPLLVTLDGGGR